MQYIDHYPAPIGNMVLCADDIGLTGLYFEEQKHFELSFDEYEEKDIHVFEEATM